MFSFLLIISHSYYYEHQNDAHVAGLTRRKTSVDDYGRPSIRLPSDKTWYQFGSPGLKARGQQDESYQIDDLVSRIDDLKRIKLSISNELRLIEREKNKLLKEKTALMSKNDKLLTQINKSRVQLKQLELDISAGRNRKFEKTCDIGCVSPIVFNPLKSEGVEAFTGLSDDHYNGSWKNSSLRETNYPFDFSLCPLTKEFKFHLRSREPDDQYSKRPDDQRYKIDLNVVEDILRNHRQHTADVSDACLVVTVSEFGLNLDLDSRKNNLIIDIADSDSANGTSRSGASRAVLASTRYPNGSYRSQLDIILPSIWQSPLDYDTTVGSIPSQSPIDRKYLASYFGDGSPELHSLEETLQIIHRNSIDDLFLFIYDCGMHSNLQCYEDKEKMIEASTYLIILPAGTSSVSQNTNDLIYLALSRGTIPVIIGKERTRLPFDEVIDWRRAALLINTARLPEIHFILRSISPTDLYKMKYHGRRIFENYLATAKQILDTTISIISLERFNYPPPPIEDVKTTIYLSDNEQIFDTNCTSAACQEAATDSSLNGLMVAEIFGPREKQVASQSYRRNFSLALSLTYDLWNNPMYNALQLFPSYPVDPPAPSEYKFLSANQGYRPIGGGLGGSGIEFSRAIGGDYPNEQFTIVLLTYERKTILMKTLERLKGLAYLNKILVVWNNPNHPPQSNLVWPDVGVPILVVKVDRNSLNNRFLPYDAIETDAILSLDDDSPLRQDEIVLAFRIWRQSRDRIVGFPGRYHSWDSSQNSWMYNSNHSCELSMVLTGGAFYHKYYSYIYSYSMPETIRAIVDKFMNCEDIAMNFLVAHLSRQPPIKVTSRWTFHCAGCQSSLSEDDSHFRERHECLNTFASIYGYMPLLSTQHRSDSILFKTRLPHDKQKCFRYV